MNSPHDTTALALAEQTLAQARARGARHAVTDAAAHLILLHHTAGRPEQALAMARYLTDHPQEQLPGALASVALHLALAFLDNGDIDRAESWLWGDETTPAPHHEARDLHFWAWLCARCLIARGDANAARELAERTLRSTLAVAASRFGHRQLRQLVHRLPGARDTREAATLT